MIRRKAIKVYQTLKKTQMNVGTEYLQTVIRRFKYYKDQGDKVFEQLADKDFHF